MAANTAYGMAGSGTAEAEQGGAYLGENAYYYCAMQAAPPRPQWDGLVGQRKELINQIGDAWANGTVLHYYFFNQASDVQRVHMSDGSERLYSWVGADEQVAVVRDAFKKWSDVGIGLRFVEVNTRDEAEIRIGFLQDNTSWSGVGTNLLNRDYFGVNERTMNFGWDLRRQPDTAIHEIGHAIGFEHEHQNPFAGIEWDEEAVYQDLGGPPNNWSREMTFNNILNKLDRASVRGTPWDPDSVMEYPFKKGLIKSPRQFFQDGLRPAGGLSPKDKQRALALYPMLAERPQLLSTAQSVALHVKPGEQLNFQVAPEETRCYDFKTFGTSDVSMVLFEEEGGEPRFRAGDNDTGETRNAALRVKLIKDHKYILRVRVYYQERPAQCALMMW